MINKKIINNIDFVTINISNFEVVLCSLGASIFSIKLNDKYMTLTPTDIETFISKDNYYGKTIGRIANRVKDGKIDINNRCYDLEHNEGNNCLHSGSKALSNKNFKSNVIETDNGYIVCFSYHLNDMEDDLPGNLNIDVVYEISNKQIKICFNAISDKDTIFYPTNHTYYKLGENTIDSLSLKIESDKFIHPNPENLLPVEIRKIDNVMDFNNFKAITQDINNDYLTKSITQGYDHHFFFSNYPKNNPPIILKSSQYTLEFYTDFNGCQIYSDNYPRTENFYQCNEKIHRAIAIEPQDGFLERKALKANEKYSRYIKLIFINNY